MRKDYQERFIVWGMPRSGTTFLYHTIPQHPQIFVPYRKESHFFTVNYDKGFDWYHSLYDDQKANQIGADINPLYFLDDASIERVKGFNPDIKVILGVRDPVDFAISLYGNLIAHSFEVGSVEEMVEGYSWAVATDRHLKFSLSGGFMQRRIGELGSAFGKNLLLYDFTYFDQSPLPVLQALEKFLGLDPHFNATNLENVRINASGRRDFRLINSIIKNQRTLETIYRVLPSSAIRGARRLYERLSVKDKAGSEGGKRTEHLISAEQLTALNHQLTADRSYYGDLFSQSPLLLGTGDNFYEAAEVSTNDR